MNDDAVIHIAAEREVLSLSWSGDNLIDLCAGGTMYALDGTSRQSSLYYPFDFDAVVSSPSGRYAVIYQRLGTKGLLLREGDVLREINRSYYHATAYDYPITFATLPDGRDALVHCPNHYNELRIEDADSGEELPPRGPRKPADFFQSRLAACPSGRWLISAGWIWHPFETVAVYDFRAALRDGSLLDVADHDCLSRQVEIHSAAWSHDDRLLVWSASDAEDFRDDEDRAAETQPAMQPSSIGVYDLDARRLKSVARVEEEVGTMMPVGPEHVIGFYEHPKLIHITTGRIVHRWRDIHAGNPKGSISHHLPKPPPIALDPTQRRFAVANGKSISVVQLPPTLPA